MSTPQRLTPRQLLIWAVIIGACVILGLVFIIFGMAELASKIPAGAFQLPLGVVLFVFGVLMAVFLARRQGRSSKI
jgi:uncharacterized integral membrane protein